MSFPSLKWNRKFGCMESYRGENSQNEFHLVALKQTHWFTYLTLLYRPIKVFSRGYMPILQPAHHCKNSLGAWSSVLMSWGARSIQCLTFAHFKAGFPCSSLHCYFIYIFLRDILQILQNSEYFDTPEIFWKASYPQFPCQKLSYSSQVYLASLLRVMNDRCLSEITRSRIW